MGWTLWSDKLAGTTDYAVATVVFNGKMHVLAVGIDDKTIWLKSTADGNNWGDWASLDRTTDAAVAPVVFDDKLYVFAKSLDDKIHKRSKARTGGWGDWQPFAGTTNVAPAAAVFHGVLYVFIKRPDNQICYRMKAIGGEWTDWQPLGGTTDVPVAPVKFQNRLYVFAKGLDDDQVWYSSRGESGGWDAWQGLGGKTNVALAAVVYAGDLHVFSKGLSDKRIYGYFVGRNNSWRGWYPIPPVDATTRTALAAETFLDRLHLFGVGVGDKKIYTQRQVIYDLPFEPDGTWVSGGNWDTGSFHRSGEQAFDYDFSHPVGAEIHAVRGGQVIFLENNSAQADPSELVGPSFKSWGTCVHIRHADGSVAAYMHLKFNSIKRELACNANVAKGQIIGLSGHTGVSSDPHLHFGMHSFEQLASTCDSSTPEAIVQGPHIPIYFKARAGSPYRPPKGDLR